MLNSGIDRRDFLRASSGALVLPLLPSLAGGTAVAAAKKESTKKAKRIVCVSYKLGLYKRSLFPTGCVEGGVQDPAHRLRKVLFEEKGLQNDITTFSGLDHQGVYGQGHGLAKTFLTGGLGVGISLDQLAANHVGKEGTRFKSLQLSSGAGSNGGGGGFSYTENSVPYPTLKSPELFFNNMFGVNLHAKAKQKYTTTSGKSLLDEFTQEAKLMQKGLNREDQHKLDEYFNSIRGVEKQLERKAKWQDKPYPKPDGKFKLPEVDNIDAQMILVNEQLMCDLIAIALKNNTTRVVSLEIPLSKDKLYLDENTMSLGYHGASHFGTNAKTVAGLIDIQERHMRSLARMIKALKDAKDHNGESILDSTIVLSGSAMGESSNHTRRNYPIIVAGGGFKHKGHVACNTKEIKNVMACDLYVTLLQRMGINVDSFGVSRSNLNEVFSA